jgi:hypothetical protein
LFILSALDVPSSINIAAHKDQTPEPKVTKCYGIKAFAPPSAQIKDFIALQLK